MSEHTPGPWIIRDTVAYGSNIYAGEVWVGTAEASRAYDHRPAVKMGFPVSADESYANARLISAAPELLEACKRALKELEARDDDSLAFARMGLALAIERAEGQGG
jgi:hypothetical protein